MRKQLVSGRHAPRGLPYRTPAVGGGGGSPISRQNEQNQLISVCDGVDQNPNILCLRHIWKPPYAFYSSTIRFGCAVRLCAQTSCCCCCLNQNKVIKRRCGGLKCCMQSVQSSTQRTLALTPSWNVTESSSRAWTYFPHSEVSATIPMVLSTTPLVIEGKLFSSCVSS